MDGLRHPLAGRKQSPEHVAKRIAAMCKHGDNRTCTIGRSPEYRAWDAMIQRCTNPNNGGYSNYGGRGITVFESWFSYPNFLSDMGRKPSSSHSIDRINSDGNYEPKNCRWATPKQQAATNRGTFKFRSFIGPRLKDGSLYSPAARLERQCQA